MTIYNFNMLYVFLYYLKACSYAYSRVQIIDIHVYERWLFQVPPARFGSSMQCLSQTVGRLFHGSFFERFSLTGTGIVCKYIPWLFSNSAYAFVPQKYSICLVLCPLIWIVCIFYLYIEAHNYHMFFFLNKHTWFLCPPRWVHPSGRNQGPFRVCHQMPGLLKVFPFRRAGPSKPSTPHCKSVWVWKLYLYGPLNMADDADELGEVHGFLSCAFCVCRPRYAALFILQKHITAINIQWSSPTYSLLISAGAALKSPARFLPLYMQQNSFRSLGKLQSNPNTMKCDPSQKPHLKSKNEFSWKPAALVFIQNAFEEFATRSARYHRCQHHWTANWPPWCLRVTSGDGF